MTITITITSTSTITTLARTDGCTVREHLRHEVMVLQRSQENTLEVANAARSNYRHRRTYPDLPDPRPGDPARPSK